MILRFRDKRRFSCWSTLVLRRTRELSVTVLCGQLKLGNQQIHNLRIYINIPISANEVENPFLQVTRAGNKPLSKPIQPRTHTSKQNAQPCRLENKMCWELGNRLEGTSSVDIATSLCLRNHPHTQLRAPDSRSNRCVYICGTRLYPTATEQEQGHPDTDNIRLGGNAGFIATGSVWH